MWGILSVIGIATASAAKHLMDMNDAENEKMKKKKETKQNKTKLRCKVIRLLADP